MTKETTALSVEDIAAAIQAASHSAAVCELTSREIAKALSQKLGSQPVPGLEVARFAEVDLPTLPETAAPRFPARMPGLAGCIFPVQPAAAARCSNHSIRAAM